MIECPATGLKEGVASSVGSSPPVSVPISDDSRLETPIIDEDDEEGRVAKRRKLGNDIEVETLLKHERGVTQVSQDVDEDIEVDVC